MQELTDRFANDVITEISAIVTWFPAIYSPVADNNFSRVSYASSNRTTISGVILVMVFQ